MRKSVLFVLVASLIAFAGGEPTITRLISDSNSKDFDPRFPGALYRLLVITGQVLPGNRRSAHLDEIIPGNRRRPVECDIRRTPAVQRRDGEIVLSASINFWLYFHHITIF